QRLREHLRHEEHQAAIAELLRVRHDDLEDLLTQRDLALTRARCLRADSEIEMQIEVFPPIRSEFAPDLLVILRDHLIADRKRLAALQDQVDDLGDSLVVLARFIPHFGESLLETLLQTE